LKTCLILALDGSPLTSVSGPLEILGLANRQAGAEHRLQLRVVAESAASIEGAGGLTLSSHSQLSEEQRPADLIIIAAIGHPQQRTEPIAAQTLEWLRDQHQQGAEIATICTGAFVLAETGLLNGHRATTHWACDGLFRQRFPDIELHCEEMITESERLLCSGGASAFQDMSLHLVRRYMGEAIARQCARSLLVDLDRHSQLRYQSFVPGRQHNDALVHQLQDWLGANFARECTLPELAKQVHLSERQMIRRFKTATGEAPLAYIQALRIEQAKTMLASTSNRIEQISLDSGYQDVRFFRNLFKRHTGLSPTEFRHKFSMGK